MSVTQTSPNSYTVSNTGVLSLAGGNGISLSGATGDVTVSRSTIPVGRLMNTADVPIGSAATLVVSNSTMVVGHTYLVFWDAIFLDTSGADGVVINCWTTDGVTQALTAGKSVTLSGTTPSRWASLSASTRGVVSETTLYLYATATGSSNVVAKYQNALGTAGTAVTLVDVT